MSFKMYTNNSFASAHTYMVLQAKLRIGKSGNRYIHFQVPGPAINRDYGYSFDIELQEGEKWDELVKVFEKAEATVTNEKEEIEQSKLEKAMYDEPEPAEDSKEDPELIVDVTAVAATMHDNLVKVLEEYKEQLNG